MSKEKMESLTRIISKNKRLESLLYCYLEDNKIKLISGHHRLKAAKEAGLKHLYIMLEVNKIDKEDVRYKQLYHNSLQGVDDLQVINEMIKDIEDDLKKMDLCIDGILPIFDKIDNLELDKEEIKSMVFFFVKEVYENVEKIIDDLNYDIDLNKYNLVILTRDKIFNRIRNIQSKNKTKLINDKLVFEKIIEYAYKNKKEFYKFIDESLLENN